MSLTGHILPIGVVIAMWFVGTGLVAWIDNRARHTFAASLRISGIAALAGLLAIALTLHDGGVAAAYISFAGGLAIWTWQEIAFLTGAVTGPVTTPNGPALKGWPRFLRATMTVIHHEIALAATALILLLMSWGAVNQTGSLIFTLLFGLRLSAKLNIFAGVPNMSDEMLPPHLSYLKTYFGPRRMTGWLALSLAGIALLIGWLGALALAAPADSGAAVAMSLAFAFALLGGLEHIFLALPFRDGTLWRWAVPSRGEA